MSKKSRWIMWWNDLYQRRLQLGQSRRVARHKAAGNGLRLSVEQLEDRTLLSSYIAGTVSALIADINAASAAGGANTITLVAGTSFTLASVNNTTNGPTGLPVIAANDNLTIVGNGDVIQRSTARGTPNFRLLDVAAGASLTLQSLTLQGGVDVEGPFGVGLGGGAIYDYGGTLSLSAVTIQNNVVTGAGADGGGIYSEDGSLTMQNCIVRNNQAIGSTGPNGSSGYTGRGGGIYILGGTASLNNVTLDSNSAQGGKGGKSGKTANSGGKGFNHFGPGNGGDGLGGGVYVASGSVTLLNTSLSNNSATGGKAGGNTASDGLGEGGGLYIAALASVGLDAFTVAHIINNTASTAYPNIYGSYSTL